MKDKQFAIQLANGRERTFASAAEMVAWMNEQRGLEYSGRQATRSPGRRPRKGNRGSSNRPGSRRPRSQESGDPNRLASPRSGKQPAGRSDKRSKSKPLPVIENELPLARYCKPAAKH